MVHSCNLLLSQLLSKCSLFYFLSVYTPLRLFFFFFFNNTAPTEISPLSLHDPLPICPRALGNRSILADPRRSEMKNIVNTKIKYREPFRPFAPVVLAECAQEYFEFPDVANHLPPRFMLMVSPVKPEKRSQIPATTHEGGTGRLQTIDHETNPRYYEVIKRFGQATGVPVLLNTSFNLRGEPIVSTPANAWNTFNNSGLDLLAMWPFLVKK